MARLEGKKPNAGAIIIGAIIFSLAAAGLFFAFRPVPEPTDAGLSNSAPAQSSSENTTDANAASGDSTNSLSTILTPLPLATPTVAPTATADNSVMPSDNSASVEPAATAPVAAMATQSPAPTPTVMSLPNVEPTPVS